ncbi:Sperm-associated antigen 17 [Trebouxia sp. C0009 RCD-2024]
MGLADVVATAVPGWCVCDLAVGSLALQDPPSTAHGVHVTFSAKQQLSGWQAPAAASEEEGQGRFTPAGVRPRLFVVFEDGGGYEVLDQDLFTAYAQRKAQEAGCQVSECEVQNAAEAGTRSLTFLTHQELRAGEVAELPMAEVAMVRPATPPAALPALQPPSQVQRPASNQTLVMPRLATFQPTAARAASKEEVWRLRQVTQYPAFTPPTLAAINSALRAWTIWQKKQSQQQPARYAAVHEARSAEDRRTAAELTARLTKLRNDHKDSAAHVASELSQPPPNNDKPIEAGAVEPVPKEKKPWPAKVGPYDHTVRKPSQGTVLAYWQAEEGLKAADCMTEAPQEGEVAESASSAMSRGRQHPPRRVDITGSHVGGLEADGEADEPSVAPEASRLDLHIEAHSANGSPHTQHAGLASLHQVQSLTLRALTARHHEAVCMHSTHVRPAGVAPNEAATSLNASYLSNNEGALNMSRTTSASLLRMRGKATKQFVLRPGHLDFGIVKLNQVVQQTAKLTNVSLERARFTVHKPQLPLQASCPTGPLAAGMETSIKITFQSKDVGDYSGELHVSSEFNTFSVTVSAKVIPSESQLESQDSELPLDALRLPHSKQ